MTEQELIDAINHFRSCRRHNSCQLCAHYNIAIADNNTKEES